MGKAIILGLALAIASLASAQAETAQRQFGNVIYTPPEGWRPGRDENGLLTYLSDLPDDACEYCYIYLSTSLMGQTDPVRAIAKHGLRFLDEDDRGGVTPIQDAGTFIVGARPGAAQTFRDGSSVLFVFAVGLSDRVEMAALYGSVDDDERLAQLLDVFENTMSPMVERFAFVSEGAPSLLPVPVLGDMDGVWWGWRTGYTSGLDLVVQMTIESRTLVFWPDGRFFDGMPPDGLSASPDFDPLTAEGRTDFGVYTRDADRLTLTFANGETEVLEANGGGWNEGDRTLNPAAPLPDGTALTGRISSTFYTGFSPGAGLEGGISASSETVFSPDGTYTGSSFGGASANYDGGGFTVGDGDDTGGTYRVRDGLLHFTPDDGTAPRAVIALEVDDMIILGDQFLDTD